MPDPKRVAEKISRLIAKKAKQPDRAAELDKKIAALKAKAASADKK